MVEISDDLKKAIVNVIKEVPTIKEKVERIDKIITERIIRNIRIDPSRKDAQPNNYNRGKRTRRR